MTCKVGALLDESGPLDPDDRATLTRTIADPSRGPGFPGYSASVVSRALASIGHQVGATTIKDHRASRCACTRKA